MKFLLRRLIRALLLMLGVSLLCFLFTEMAPGSFFDDMRLNPQISPETIASLRSHYGLDQPLAARYAHWLRAALHADFGNSIAYNSPVGPLLWERAKNTLLLTTVGLALTWMLSLPIGVWSASRHDRPVDRLVHAGTSLLISIPEVVIGLTLLAIVVRWRILPVGGIHSLDSENLSGWDRTVDTVRHLVLPVTALVLLESSIIVRHVRASVVEALASPAIAAARGFGIPKLRLLYRHALPLAASPVISLFGFSLAGLISGSLLVEVICGWPGLGPLILDATLSRDLAVVIGGTMLSAMFMVGGNLVADVMLLAADPRIRIGEADAN
jgi:peptide/nickel transport system permease protein